MDDKIYYIVGDKFINLCEYDGIVSFSQIMNGINNNPNSTIKYVAGQGLSDIHIHTLTSHGLKLIKKKSARIDNHLVHKRREENVLITTPTKENETQYHASLIINEQCAEMSDHVTGKHIQGNILFEAARQMFMACFQLYIMGDDKQGKLSYALDDIQVRFSTFLFPFDVDIHLTVVEGEWNHKEVWKGKADIKFLQLGKVGCDVICKATGYPSKRLKRLEDKWASKVCNIIRNHKNPAKVN
ncbi:MAG: AfsA-related hotdog domain-containing protein [Nitrospirota bacterium]